MKQIYLFITAVLVSTCINAQNDTLIWEDFNGESWTQISDIELLTNCNNSIVYDYPTAMSGDDKWYNVDLDGAADQNDRPMEWFRALALTDDDSAAFDAVYASSSWFSSPAAAENMLITKSFYCSSDAILSWYTAPRQTPLYLDGYKVKVSIATNDPFDFTATIFTAAEYQSRQPGDSCLFSNYTFVPASNFVHGQDGTYITDNGDPVPDCQRNWGSLRKQTVNLSQFAGKRIYIAFVHDSYDDNLITLDNVLVTGTFIDDTKINESDLFTFSTFPNPSTDVLNINYTLNGQSDVTIRLVDFSGRTVKQIQLANQNGTTTTSIDMTDVATGIYNVSIETTSGKATKKVVKR